MSKSRSRASSKAHSIIMLEDEIKKLDDKINGLDIITNHPKARILRRKKKLFVASAVTSFEIEVSSMDLFSLMEYFERERDQCQKDLNDLLDLVEEGEG